MTAPDPAPDPAPPSPPRKARLWAMAGGALLLVAVASAGAWYTLVRNADPVARAERLEAVGDVRAAQLEWRNAVAKAPRDAERHLRLGKALLRLFETFSAEKELRLALNLGADRWAVLPVLGDVLVAQGRWRAVLAELPRSGAPPEAAARLLMQRSIAQLGNNDVAAAETTLAAAEAAAPGRWETLLIAARVALARNDLAAAEAKVDAALELVPERTDALLMKAQMLASRKDAPGALRIADRAVASAPWDPPPRLDRANQLMTIGQDDKARADVATILARFPNLPGAVFLDAMLLARANRYKDAWSAFEKLAPAVDLFPRALYVQSLVAANLGNAETAMDLARRYNSRMPFDADGIRLLARTLLLVKRPDLVAPLLEKAVANGLSDPLTLDLLGSAYAGMGEDAAALRIRRKAAELAPTDADIVANLGQLQLKQGDPAGVGTLERSVQLSAGQPGELEAAIEAALAARDLDRAQTSLDRLRARDGETEQVGLLTGTLLMARNDPAAARRAFAATAKAFPDSTPAKVNLAKALILGGTLPEGEALLRDVLAKTPADMTALTAELQLRLQNDDFAAAIRAVEKARAAMPADPLLAAMHADLLIRSGDPARALKMLEAKRDAGEMTAALLGALARAQRATDARDQAIGTYARQLKASPTDAEARPAQVDLLLRAGKPDEARASLKEGLAQAPGTYGLLSALVTLEARTAGLDAALNLAATFRRDPAQMPAATLLRGDALMAAKQYEQAAQAYRAEFERSPLPALASRAALAHIAAGQDDEAATLMLAWLRDHPGDPNAAQLLARLDLKRGRTDEAQTHLETVLAARPDDSIALNNLAWLYLSKKDPRARELAQRAYLQAPGPRVADTLGWILVQQGDSKAAINILDQAWRQAQSDPALTYHLAVAYRDDQKPDWAIQLLRPLLDRPEPFADRLAAAKLLQDLTSN